MISNEVYSSKIKGEKKKKSTRALRTVKNKLQKILKLVSKYITRSSNQYSQIFTKLKIE